jgi:hypothetical protein
VSESSRAQCHISIALDDGEFQLVIVTLDSYLIVVFLCPREESLARPPAGIQLSFRRLQTDCRSRQCAHSSTDTLRSPSDYHTQRLPVLQSDWFRAGVWLRGSAPAWRA